MTLNISSFFVSYDRLDNNAAINRIDSYNADLVVVQPAFVDVGKDTFISSAILDQLKNSNPDKKIFAYMPFGVRDADKDFYEDIPADKYIARNDGVFEGILVDSTIVEEVYKNYITAMADAQTGAVSSRKFDGIFLDDIDTHFFAAVDRIYDSWRGVDNIAGQPNRALVLSEARAYADALIAIGAHADSAFGKDMQIIWNNGYRLFEVLRTLGEPNGADLNRLSNLKDSVDGIVLEGETITSVAFQAPVFTDGYAGLGFSDNQTVQDLLEKDFSDKTILSLRGNQADAATAKATMADGAKSGYITYAARDYILANQPDQWPQFNTQTAGDDVAALDLLNVTSFSGGDGADIIIGSNLDDVIFGNSETANGLPEDQSADGADEIHGRGGNDIIYGNQRADVLRGDEGNDTLVGGRSGDDIDGGAGIDTAILTGNLSDYDITKSGGTYTILDKRAGSPSGSDTVVNVEKLQFDDQVLEIDSSMDGAAGSQALRTAFNDNPETARGLTAAYTALLDGVPNQSGYSFLINQAASSNFGAGPGVTFNAENVFINLLNNLVQGNTQASETFASIATGQTLAEKVASLYTAIVPAAEQSSEGLAFITRAEGLQFYQDVAAERGVTGTDGAAVVALASLLKIAVDNNLGVGNAINDLFNAVSSLSSIVPTTGATFTPLEIADGTQFDSDDLLVSSSGGQIETGVYTEKSGAQADLEPQIIGFNTGYDLSY